MATQAKRLSGRTLKDFVTGLSEGSRCFCCGRDVMLSAPGGAPRVAGDRSQPVVCPFCGSEVADAEDPVPAGSGERLLMLSRMAEKTAA